jgi:hypothetical protein
MRARHPAAVAGHSISGWWQRLDVVLHGRKVRRIWRYDYTGKVSSEMAGYVWH